MGTHVSLSDFKTSVKSYSIHYIYPYLVVSLPGKTRVACPLLFFKIFKVASKRKWTCRRFKTALHDTVLHTDALCQISGSWPVWFLRKIMTEIFCEADDDDDDARRRRKTTEVIPICRLR